MVAGKTNGDNILAVRANIFFAYIQAKLPLFTPEKRDVFLKNTLSVGSYSLFTIPVLNGLVNFHSSIISNAQSRIMNYNLRGILTTNIRLSFILLGVLAPIWRSCTQGCNDSVIMRSVADTIFFTPIRYQLFRNRQAVQLKELDNNGSQFKELQHRIVSQDKVSRFAISRYYSASGWQMLYYGSTFFVAIHGGKYIRSSDKTWLGVQEDTPLMHAINIVSVSMLSGMASASMAWCGYYHAIHARKGLGGYKETAKALYDSALCSEKRPLLRKALMVRMLICAVTTIPFVADRMYPMGDKIMSWIDDLVAYYHSGEGGNRHVTERVLGEGRDQCHNSFYDYSC